MSADLLHDAAFKSAVAGGLALAFGGAPLGVLLIARRVSLIGDALSHALLPGIAIAYLTVGHDPAALTAGALIAALIVAGLSTLLARTRALPEDASLAVFYLTALALGVAVIVAPLALRNDAVSVCIPAPWIAAAHAKMVSS